MHHSSSRRRRKREEQERLRREEEETLLTNYSSTDMAEDWQFKIVKGNYSSRDAVESEIAVQRCYGWIFVEKFDDERLRFKRSSEEAAKDSSRGGDPYNTGGTGCAAVFVALGFILLLTSVVLAR